MIRRHKDDSRSLTSHLNIPVPDGLSFYEHQKAAIEYALQRTDTLVADEMGVGKTPTGIGFSNCLPDAQWILIICPASMKLVWEREFRRFDTKGLSVGVAGKTYPDTDVVIINYDILHKYRQDLRAREFDILIADEIHMAKCRKSIRTREIFGGIKRDSNKKIIERVTPIQAKRCLYLTGTPMLNGQPREMWPLIQSIDSEGLGSDWFAFARRYCGLFEIERYNPAKGKKEHVGWKWDGAENLEELQTIMRQRFMIRRLKSEVLKDLPPKTRQVIVLEAKKSLTKLLKREMLEYEQYAKEHGEDGFDPPPFSEIAKIRKEVALAKVPYVIDYLREVLEETSKAVVWVHHHEVGEAISSAFGTAAARVDGRTDLGERQRAIDAFQIDSAVRLFIGGIKSAGTGITLTAASVAVFAELDWVPASVTQAEDRIWRIGQQNNVLIRHVVLSESLDERMANAIITKQEIADRTLDKKTINL